MSQFIYTNAFSRNFGWVTASEQEILRNTKVAIAGLGGVGGSHLIALVRLGVQNFHLADLDVFEIANINRQYGATTKTIGQEKVEVMVKLAQDINPDIQIKTFKQGVNKSNLSEFFEGVDLFIDGLDAFEFETRDIVFDYCHKNNIHALTAVPAGMGTSVLHFSPRKMSFSQYFGFKKRNSTENFLRFMLGLTPSLQQKNYLVEQTVNPIEQKAPSTVMGCFLASGVIATEALKIILKRGPVWAAPWSNHYDAYNQQLTRTWQPFGARNPIYLIKLFCLKFFLKL